MGAPILPPLCSSSFPHPHHASRRRPLHTDQKCDYELSSNLSLSFLMLGIIFNLLLKPNSFLPLTLTSSITSYLPSRKTNCLHLCSHGKLITTVEFLSHGINCVCAPIPHSLPPRLLRALHTFHLPCNPSRE